MYIHDRVGPARITGMYTHSLHNPMQVQWDLVYADPKYPDMYTRSTDHLKMVHVGVKMKACRLTLQKKLEIVNLVNKGKSYAVCFNIRKSTVSDV